MRSESVWALCLLSLLFLGCASKEQKALLKTYEKEKTYHKKLLQTEKAQLSDGNETKVLLTATYLFDQSEVKKEEDKRDEVFIVGLYMEDETADELLSRDFNLTLEGAAPKSVRVLKRSDSVLKNVPLVTEWGDYFEVIFPHTARTRFDLRFTSEIYGTATLHFAKKAKYVFTKEAF